MDKTMRAVVVRAPMDFKVEDVPVPAVPEKVCFLRFWHAAFAGLICEL